MSEQQKDLGTRCACVTAKGDAASRAIAARLEDAMRREIVASLSGPDDQEIVGAGEYRPRSREAVNGVASTASESDNGLGATSAGGESGLPHAARREHQIAKRDGTEAAQWYSASEEWRRRCGELAERLNALRDDIERQIGVLEGMPPTRRLSLPANRAQAAFTEGKLAGLRAALAALSPESP